MHVEFIVELKKGYRPVTTVDEVTEIRFVVEETCYANASRMVKALLQGADNIEDIDSVCLD